MAYTMTHILIAEKILPFLDGPIDYASYLLGTIAPDAVHASADYSASLKERSHLCAPNAKWGRIVQEEDLTEWVNVIRAFYLANKNRYEKSFFSGYMVHLLADVCTIKKIYAPFYLSIGADFDAAMTQYKKENFGINYDLYREYAKEKDLFAILRSGRPCFLENVFDKELIDARIAQLRTFEFNVQNRQQWGNPADYKICTEESIKSFIDEAPAMIKDLLADGFI